MRLKKCSNFIPMDHRWRLKNQQLTWLLINSLPTVHGSGLISTGKIVLSPYIDTSIVNYALAGGTQKADPESPPIPRAIGAPHACEIEYCMGNLNLIDDYAWTPEDYLVSKTMQRYFANFIKTGDPNGTDLPNWDPAKSDDKSAPVMIIDVESKMVESTVEDRYEFLDSYYSNN